MGKMGLILEERVVHLPELTLRPGRQRRFVRQRRVRIRRRRRVLEDHTDVSGVSEKAGDDAGGAGAGEGFEVGEDENSDRRFVRAADAGDWLNWLLPCRWIDLTTRVAGLWRSNLRRSEKQERGQGQIKVLAETVQLVTVPAFSSRRGGARWTDARCCAQFRRGRSAIATATYSGYLSQVHSQYAHYEDPK